MTRPLLILRPEAGATDTARRAEALGLRATVASLFAIAPVEWTAPDPDRFDALLLTSAKAVRHSGPQLARYAALPVHAVGEATAEAAREAGFTQVMAGTGNAADLVAALRPGLRLLHLCGWHRSVPNADILQIPIYRANAASCLPPEAEKALRDGAVALLHSSRAAQLFATLFDRAGLSRADTAIVAISPEAASAAGTGWRACLAAPQPTDAAMLAIACKLCKNQPP